MGKLFSATNKFTSHKGFLFAAFFFAVFISIAITVGSKLTSAIDSVTKTDVYSAHADFNNNDEGAWHIEKTVQISNLSHVETTVDVETILKGDSKAKDILVVMDTSGSMRDNNKIDDLRSSIFEMAQSLTADQNNRVGLIDFSTEAVILSDFTNQFDRVWTSDDLAGHISSLTAGGGTNYYQAFRRMEEIFATYEPRDNCSPIVLFITDGEPVEDSPLEISEYQAFKSLYPDIPIRAIQYDMGETVNPTIATVSDVQYIAQVDNLIDVVFDAVQDGYRYSEFIIDDLINGDYFEVESINADLGEATYDDATGHIIWNLSHALRSGRHAKLSYIATVTDACIYNESGFCKTSLQTEVASKIQDGSDEHITTTDSPILRFWYDISYNLNAPNDCEIHGAAPSTARALVYTSQEISSTTPTCAGYAFHGWAISEGGATRYNDDHFLMPEANVVIRATWSKLSISKSMNGSVAPITHTMLAPSGTYRNRVNGAILQNNTDKPVAFKRSDTISADFATENPNYNIAASDDLLPIYAWYDEDARTLWYYTDADIVDMNPYSAGLFEDMHNLEDISGVTEWNAETATDFTGLFHGTQKLTDISPLANWNTQNVTSLNGAFWESAFTAATALANWDTTNVTDMTRLFLNAKITDFSGLANWNTGSVTTLELTFCGNQSQTPAGLENWDVSNVVNMNKTFNGARLTDLSALANWDVSNVKWMTSTFYGIPASSLNGLQNWQPIAVESLNVAFANMTNLTDASALQNWPTHSLTNINETFTYTKLDDLTGLSGWDTSKVTEAYGTFAHTAITSTRGLEDWDVRKIWNFSATFSDCYNLSDLSGLRNWDTASATNMVYIFINNRSVTSLTPLANWDVSHVTTMMHGFRNMDSLTSLDGLQNWDISQLDNLHNTFSNNDNLADISALAHWTPKKLTSISEAFTGDTKLTSLNGLAHQLITPDEGEPYYAWDTSKLVDLVNAFYGCTSLADISALADWDVSSAKWLGSVFRNTAITSVASLANWRLTSAVSIETMFGATKLVTLAGLENWGISASLNTMAYAFENITTLTDISALAYWRPSSCYNFNGVFNGVSALTSLHGLENWTVGNGQLFEGAFSNMTSLTDISALTSWDVSKAASFSDIFAHDSSLTSVEALLGWTTTSLTNLTKAFLGTGLLNLHGLENFNTTNVSSLFETFRDAASLTDISALSGWNVGHVTNATRLFYNDRLITDFTPLNGWNTESFDARSQGTFSNTDSNATFPSWY